MKNWTMLLLMALCLMGCEPTEVTKRSWEPTYMPHTISAQAWANRYFPGYNPEAICEADGTCITLYRSPGGHMSWTIPLTCANGICRLPRHCDVAQAEAP